MKLTGHLQKWASGVLGAVCLVLLISLAQSSRPVRAGGTRTRAAASAPAAARQSPPANHRGNREISPDDPEVRLDLLKEIQTRPLLEFGRNPFEFEPVKPDPRTITATVPALAPPPPPPLPIKALGYSEKAGGVREAYVTDDDQVYTVHQGESFAGHFRALRIETQIIEIEDETTHQKAQLPFPQ